MKIGFCDDDTYIFPEIHQIIQDYMNQNGISFQFHTFENEHDLKCFLQTQSLDLLLMDIDMPDKNGIQLADEILEMHPNCQIAFCTNYLDFATDVYETKHCYYVLKNEFKNRLPKIINKVIQGMSVTNATIYLDTHSSKESVSVSDILYIERVRKKSFIYLKNGVVIDTFLSLDEFLALLNPHGFARCHQSFVVSLDKIKKHTRIEIIMSDGTPIPISRPYIQSVKDSFTEWIWLKMGNSNKH